MAIYHCSVGVISRSKGRSATAAAAYRAGCQIVDERTGEEHDYRRKRGVLSATLIVPPGAPVWAGDRAALWNGAEQSETRKNSTVAREFEIALPCELTDEQQQQLALEFGREIMQRHGCAVDVALHAPDKGRRKRTGEDIHGGDPRNKHAHILTSTRRLTGEGFGEKCRELDDLKTGQVAYWRRRWAELANEHLERAGRPERIDHRSLADQGINRLPTQHEGPAVTQARRRDDAAGLDRADHNDRVTELNALRARLTEVDAEIAQEKARLAAEQAERERLAAQERLRAEQAERRRQEAELLASLAAPSPAPRSELSAIEPDKAESSALERRGGDDEWVYSERDGERYRHPEGRPNEEYWLSPSGEWFLQPEKKDEPDGYGYDDFDYR